MTSAPSLGPRSPRADARRSYRRIVDAATEVFLRDGAEASLEEIARRAGVGSATLHRHFPSRWVLLDAVFADGIDDLRAQADQLSRNGNPAAMLEWLQLVGDYCLATRGLAAALLQHGDRKQATTTGLCHQALIDAGTGLLDAAQDAGLIRSDVTINDLLTLVFAIALATEYTPADGTRLVRLALNGIHPDR
ncbi:hypothetical protein A5714_11070 [Mycobacterium sp. E2462]|uniref:TetR/AcrR family transcriptional regulator n=1 Tax=Mycobacterium sp. E2462 TaxID=1834133 RepID=UPI0007FBF6FF|nr:TetR/AcrR family transcriptional regulator [Mycobacterium sp. E2462]OBI16661.1 hypothetical protein A5714_11070 [Mycobacterium sp. E2462]